MQYLTTPDRENGDFGNNRCDQVWSAPLVYDVMPCGDTSAKDTTKETCPAARRGGEGQVRP